MAKKNTRKVHFSTHAIERYKERFKRIVRGREALPMLEKEWESSELDSSIINNTKYITYCYEKYGYKPMQFYKNKRVVFLVRDNCVVTVFERKGSKHE